MAKFNVCNGDRARYIGQDSDFSRGRTGKGCVILQDLETENDESSVKVLMDGETQTIHCYIKNLVIVQVSALDKAEDALDEILRVHENDNPRPKAFYIAARYFGAKL